MRFLSDDPTKRDLSYKGGLKVIAAGLPRCATSSLQAVLENDLGFGPCMHMAYVAPHLNLLKICYEAENEPDKEKRQKLLHKLFDGYRATADFPGFPFVDDLMEMYPDAKVILNQRKSADQWLSSITGTLKFFTTTPFMFITYLIPTNYWQWKILQAMRPLTHRRFGIGDTKDGIFVREFYNAHNNWVRETAKRNGNQIIEWQPEHGWEPLCKFLGKPVPDKPFPRLNEENVIRLLITVVVLRGLLAWAALLSSPALVYWGWLLVTKK